MKAAVFYILIFCFGLIGAHNHAHATALNGKLSFAATNTVHKQVVEDNNFIDVEDENDDKDVTRKFTHQAKWIPVITAFVSLFSDNHAENYLVQSRVLDDTGSNIFIEHRVLRI